jgi:hypothetical protein
VLGGVIRQTSTENRYFGETAQGLRDSATDMVREGMHNVAERASGIAEAVVDAVSNSDSSGSSQAGKGPQTGATPQGSKSTSRVNA